MSEVSPFRIPISHAEAIRYREMRDEYDVQRLTAIAEGKQVWMIRDIHDVPEEPDPVVIMDFYLARETWGYIEGSEQDGWQVYGPAIEEDKDYHHLNTEPKESLSEAQKTLFDYLKDTLQIQGMLE